MGVPLANGRDKSGPYNTVNKLPLFSQKAIYMENIYFLDKRCSKARPFEVHAG